MGRLGRQARTRPHRWLAWAESLYARHGRLTGRPDRTDFTLAHPLSLLQLVRERVVVSSRNFFPKVHLAIQPVLERTIWRGLLDGAHNSLIQPSQTASRAASPLWDERRFATQTGFTLTTARSEQSSHDAMRAEGIRNPSNSSHTDVSVSARDVHAPLHLVFQRLQRGDESMRAGTSDKLMRENLETFVSRVNLRTRRVEERMDQPSALITRRTPASIASRDSSLVRTSDASDETAWTGARQGDWTRSGPQPAGDWTRGVNAQAAAMNIDQLTDQVMRQLDRRVVAARERMGRI